MTEQSKSVGSSQQNNHQQALSSALNSGKILILDSARTAVGDLGILYQKSLQSIGAEVSYFNLGAIPKKRFSKLRRHISRYILNRANKRYYIFPKARISLFKKRLQQERPATVIVLNHTHPHIDKKQLKWMRESLGCQLILVDLDSGRFAIDEDRLCYYLRVEAIHYDKVLSFSPPMVQTMRHYGIPKVDYLPFAGIIQPAVENVPAKHDVCFVGTPVLRRIVCLERLAQHNLVVYGRHWKKMQSLVSDQLWKKVILRDVWQDELYDIMYQSKIIININQWGWHGVESGVNLRVFEVLGAKRLLITEYCEELKQLFELGKEIETFKTIEELVEKVDYYLAHEEERHRIAQRGFERVQRDHTWETRARQLLTHCRHV